MRDEQHIKVLRKKAMNLPLEPGVYLMRDSSGRVIYVGKAKALKNRVSQYFGSDTNHTEKVRRMVDHVADFDVVVVGSEFEALVLECSLIKQYAPKYNILLKDDKGYCYLRVTKPPFSRISEVKQQEKDGADYFGPYMSSFSLKQAVDEACKVFKLATCNRALAFGRKPTAYERPCLNYHIGQCCAPCTGKVPEADYQARVDEAVDYVLNGADKMQKTLEKRMKEAAEAEEFETAAELRDRLFAIKRLADKQKVVRSRIKEQDVIGLVVGGETACVQVFAFTKGALSGKREFLLDLPEENAAFLSEFLRRYYDTADRIPAQVTLCEPAEDKELLEQWLSEKAGRKVTLHVPERGEQAELCRMACRNAAEYLAWSEGMRGHDAAALSELQALLGLSAVPSVMECYDISHTAGQEPVASMVVFKNGRPDKKSYRKFRIQLATGGDDPGAMREVLSRRLNEFSEHEGEPDGFGRKPDVIFLDGGTAQVAAVTPLVEAFGWDVPVFGLVKDSRHRTRAVTAGNEELSLSAKRSAFTLLSTMQEEVHRVAIGYHRKTRGKSRVRTALTDIPGIGKTRAEALLKAFGSLKAVKEASGEALLGVKGMTLPAAKAVRGYFDEQKLSENGEKEG